MDETTGEEHVGVICTAAACDRGASGGGTLYNLKFGVGDQLKSGMEVSHEQAQH